MIKKLLLMGFTLAFYVSFAQFELRNTTTSELITDGQTISFSESGDNYGADYNWKFTVTNTSPNDIYMRIFVESMTNTDGTAFQLCFANVCLPSVNVDSGYPSTPALIPSGESNITGNSLWNQHPTGTEAPMSWTFRYQAFNASGAEIGTPLLVTYNYNVNLSVDESQLSKVDVYPTNAKNEIIVSSNENLTADFYDLLGRNVKQANIIVGGNTLDISDLAAQPYIIRFTNEEGQHITKKIIKK